jgi:hypothetical protein
VRAARHLRQSAKYYQERTRDECHNEVPARNARDDDERHPDGDKRARHWSRGETASRQGI